MSTNLTLSLVEISLFLASAVILGITFRHFKADRKKPTKVLPKQTTTATESLVVIHDAEIVALQDQLRLSTEKINMLTIESEELRWRHRSFEALKEDLEKKIGELSKKDNLRHLTIQDTHRIAANG